MQDRRAVATREYRARRDERGWSEAAAPARSRHVYRGGARLVGRGARSHRFLLHHFLGSGGNRAGEAGCAPGLSTAGKAMEEQAGAVLCPPQLRAAGRAHCVGDALQYGAPANRSRPRRLDLARLGGTAGSDCRSASERTTEADTASRRGAGSRDLSRPFGVWDGGEGTTKCSLNQTPWTPSAWRSGSG